MSAHHHRYNAHKLKLYKFQDYSRKITYCFTANLATKQSESDKDFVSFTKTKKINQLLSNIYIYKFPPILNWPEGIYIDIPVDFIIAMRKMLEHTDEIVLSMIKELCFSRNAEYSSYGDKIIIIPIEYIIGDYDKALFFDTFGHEIGHALANEFFKNIRINAEIKSWHKVISYYSTKFSKNLFYDPGLSDKNLAKYQLEDYKEFLAESFSQILNHYELLMNHICRIPYEEAQYSYLNMVDLLLNYVIPFSKAEKQELIKNL